MTEDMKVQEMGPRPMGDRMGQEWTNGWCSQAQNGSQSATLPGLGEAGRHPWARRWPGLGGKVGAGAVLKLAIETGGVDWHTRQPGSSVFTGVWAGPTVGAGQLGGPVPVPHNLCVGHQGVETAGRGNGFWDRLTLW